MGQFTRTQQTMAASSSSTKGMSFANNAGNSKQKGMNHLLKQHQNQSRRRNTPSAMMIRKTS